MSTIFEDKLQALADKIFEQTKATMSRRYPDYPDVDKSAKVTVKKGKKYTKLDVGNSGKYMVENTSGVVYGIKGYGVVHKGHCYGSLDTIDEYFWGGFVAFPAKEDDPND